MSSIADLNKNLEAGLNSRANDGGARTGGRKRSRSAMKKSNLMDNDDYFDMDDNGDHDGNASARGHVNQDISTVQGEVRRRAAAAEAAAQSNEIYDYDGQYESFAKGANNAHDAGGGNEKSKKAAASHFGLNPRGGSNTSLAPNLGPSRYIAKMMETANRRRQHNEIVFERNLERDRLVEEKANGDDFEDKEQFVTKSYQRKLQQRAEFVKQQQEEEARQDAHNQTGDNRKAPTSGLYGGLLRNIHHDTTLSRSPTNGDKSASRSTTIEDNVAVIEAQAQPQTQPKRHNSRWGAPPNQTTTNNMAARNGHLLDTPLDQQGGHQTLNSDPPEQKENLESIRASRIQKVLAARTRYLERSRQSQGQE